MPRSLFSQAIRIATASRTRFEQSSQVTHAVPAPQLGLAHSLPAVGSRMQFAPHIHVHTWFAPCNCALHAVHASQLSLACSSHLAAPSRTKFAPRSQRLGHGSCLAATRLAPRMLFIPTTLGRFEEFTPTSLCKLEEFRSTSPIAKKNYKYPLI